ncbi:MAG: D-tyrosyl-tRNA(Tyr) deacylase [Clostridiales bacterium]|nr:D-tyrosyl-tRNA(Tyr) deacylase [Clostridiales bacterium]
MKAVIQRVNEATLSVDGDIKAAIGRGLVVYVGIEQPDTEADIVAMCKKISAMRIFSDDAGKMNLSVADVRGEILLVSNFTLCADISHGNRPSFSFAMRPALQASLMFEYCVNVMRDLLREHGLSDNVKSGIFGADMRIDQSNDGPVTIIY